MCQGLHPWLEILYQPGAANGWLTLIPCGCLSQDHLSSLTRKGTHYLGILHSLHLHPLPFERLYYHIVSEIGWLFINTYWDGYSLSNVKGKTVKCLSSKYKPTTILSGLPEEKRYGLWNRCYTKEKECNTQDIGARDYTGLQSGHNVADTGRELLRQLPCSWTGRSLWTHSEDRLGKTNKLATWGVMNIQMFDVI